MRVKKMVWTAAILVGGIVMLGMAAWALVGLASVAGIETPQYEVESVKEEYEIRRYAPHIVAEVLVTEEYDAAMNRGFRMLADYIFGNNTRRSDGGDRAAGSEEIAMTAPVLEQEAPSTEIAMTAPVLEQEHAAGAHIVSFVMPSQYTLETLPAPNNEAVKLVEIPERRYAAVSFSGRMSEERAREMKARLQDRLKEDGVATVGAPLLAQYNPPWTPPPMRKNEVLIQLQ
jgi:hypothetical protein